MNRRRMIAMMAGAPFVPGVVMADATPESTPGAPSALDPLASPMATSVTQASYRRDSDGKRDAVRFHYFTYVFESEDDAAQSYQDAQTNIQDARESDLEFAGDWHREISIGKVGDDRIGYLQEDGDRIYGLAVKGEIMVHFMVVTVDPVDEYAEWIQPILEDSPSLDLDLSDFPSGWRYEMEPFDVTEQFT